MSLDVAKMRRTDPPLISAQEAEEVLRIYAELGRVNEVMLDKPRPDSGFSDNDGSALITAYAAAGVAKEREAENKKMADGTPLSDKRVAEHLDRAAQIRAEVFATKKQAQVTIIRRRTSGALNGVVTTAGIALFIAGLIGVSYSVDSIDAGRTADKTQVELL